MNHWFVLSAIAAVFGIWLLVRRIAYEFCQEMDSVKAGDGAALPYKVVQASTPCSDDCDADIQLCTCRFYVEPIGSACPHRESRGVGSKSDRVQRILERERENAGREFR